jgi:hypothetical protein
LLRIFLKKGREAPVLRGHPWIFSGALGEIEGDSSGAEVADVFDWEKQWIARGLFSPNSQIRVRILSFSVSPGPWPFVTGFPERPMPTGWLTERGISCPASLLIATPIFLFASFLPLAWTG